MKWVVFLFYGGTRNHGRWRLKEGGQRRKCEKVKLRA
jgi:hypothetical protein